MAFVFLTFCTTQNIGAQVKPTPAAERLAGLKKREDLEKRSTLNSIQFRNIGPTVMSGRVSDVEANPEDPTEFYVAYSSGGLWHTTNNAIVYIDI